MRYKILWIDDEYKKQADFIGAAEQEDLDVIPFESHEEGIAELEANPQYHAVILDAKVKFKKGDTVPGLDGLRASRDYLLKYNESHYLPFFVFTGQPDYAREDWFRQSYGDYYLKGRDNEKLFADIKDAVQNKAEYIIEKKYKKIFNSCGEEYFGLSSRKILMPALKIVEGFETVGNTDDLLNSIRKIYEKIFAAFNRAGFIPDEVFQQNGWITSSSKFLSGAHQDYDLEKEIFSPAISFITKNVLFISQDGSHTEGSLRFEAVKHIQKVQTDYLYKSLILQTLDVMCWSKDFLDAHPDKITNSSFWKKRESVEVPYGQWIRGSIVEINDKGWGSFKARETNLQVSIPPSLVKSKNLALDVEFSITTKQGKTAGQPFVDEIKTN